MYELIIDRSNWARGGIGGVASLLNTDGNMCCLGFLCSNLCDVPLQQLLDDDPASKGCYTSGTPDERYSMPSTVPDNYIGKNSQLIDDLLDYTPNTENYSDLIDANISFNGNSIEHILQGINDEMSISDEVREKLLTKYFKQLLDIEVKFV